jgi:hypothetical protein
MTKALHVCRHLAAAGWRVVLVETHKYWHVGPRFSSSVHAFHTVPVPEDSPEAYVNALLGAYDSTVYVPTVTGCMRVQNIPALHCEMQAASYHKCNNYHAGVRCSLL